MISSRAGEANEPVENSMDAKPVVIKEFDFFAANDNCELLIRKGSPEFPHQDDKVASPPLLTPKEPSNINVSVCVFNFICLFLYTCTYYANCARVSYFLACFLMHNIHVFLLFIYIITCL